MTLFDLLFLVAALSLLIALALTTYHALRGRGGRALAILRRSGIVAAAYFAAIAAVSIATPAQSVPIGGAQCFDDWCITVASATRSGDSLHVMIELSSRARGISQGERDVRVYVRDDSGRDYQPIVAPDAVPLSVRIPPLGTVRTERLFAVPSAARNPVLLVAHGAFPGCCIVAGRESLFHRATVVPLR